MKAIASTSDWLALSLTDAAGSLSVSPSTLKRLIAAGQLRTVRPGPRRRVVPRAELERLLQPAVSRRSP